MLIMISQNLKIKKIRIKTIKIMVSQKISKLLHKNLKANSKILKNLKKNKLIHQRLKINKLILQSLKTSSKVL